MSFLVLAALAVGAFVAAPFLAHLLRRGRAREQAFPPARLVPTARSAARQRARIEDRWLFALRAAQILVLAALGATPLVRCSRLSLARDTGASVALAVVVDDSLSMRSQLQGSGTRWDRGRRAASELVASARRGDAVAVVLAGRPARVALAPTTDLDAVRRTLAELAVSDRSTDLAGAVQIARGLLAELPQRDRQLVVLSDFASEPLPEGRPAIWAPLPELATPVEDCGVAGAERRAGRIEARVVCSSARAAEGRKLEAFASDTLSELSRTEPALASAPLVVRGGVQVVSVGVPGEREVLGVRLTGADGLTRDDSASVARQPVSLSVGVYADPSRSSASTGGPTLIEQALSALGADLSVRPFAILPDDESELRPLAALVLDDPAGLSPEVRGALGSWLGRGGVALALLGPRAEQRELGSTLEPFAEGALPWEPTTVKGLDVRSLSWLGPEAQGFSELRPRARSRLEGSHLPGARVSARWADGPPFLFERELGRGVVLTAGLPSSPDQSDFALRPGYLALLDHLVALSRERAGQRRSAPGTSWRFLETARVSVTGPEGPLVARGSEGPPDRRQQLFTPELAGRYRVSSGEGAEERTVSIEVGELSMKPQPVATLAAGDARVGRKPEVDASREAVLVLLFLIALELLLRSGRLILSRRRTPAAAAAE